MQKRKRLMLQKMGLLASAGLLLQAGGCTVNLAETAQTLITGTANTLIANFVFGMFNVPLSGF